MSLANVLQALRAAPLAESDQVRLEVFMPCTHIDSDYWVRACATLVSRVAGGCTVSYNAQVCWVDRQGKLVSEPVTVVWAYVSLDRLLTKRDLGNEFAAASGTAVPAIALRKLLVQYGRETEQEVVAFGIDNVIYGFNPKETL